MLTKPFLRKSAFLFAMLFLLSFTLFSCGGASGSETSDPSNQEQSLVYDKFGRLYVEDSVPDDLKFDGETVTVLVRDSELPKLEFGASEIKGEILNDALYERNKKVEDQLGIDIKTMVLTTDAGKYGPTNFNEKVITYIMAGTNEFDIVASNAYYGVQLGNEGYYRDLCELDYIELEKPWWNKTFVEEMTINDTLYFAVGDVSFTSIDLTYCTFFNKNLVEKYYKDVNLYDVVDNGEWTIDYLRQLVKDTYEDKDQDGLASDGDFYGIGMATAATPLDALFMGCNLTVTTKNNEGLPSFNFYNEKTTDFFDKMYDLFFNTPGVLPGEYTNESIQLMTDKFKDQQTIFVINTLYATEKSFRDVEFEYGMLPMPKMDTEQDGYYTCPADYYSILAIPNCALEAKLPLLGATLELLAAESYRSVTPAYFEEVMDYKYLVTNDDSRMYDLVLAGVRYNYGIVNSHSLNDIQHLVRDVVSEKSRDFTSAYQEKENAAQNKLDELLSFY